MILRPLLIAADTRIYLPQIDVPGFAREAGRCMASDSVPAFAVWLNIAYLSMSRTGSGSFLTADQFPSRACSSASTLERTCKRPKGRRVDKSAPNKTLESAIDANPLNLTMHKQQRNSEIAVPARPSRT
jgi:hypothetical protein